MCIDSAFHQEPLDIMSTDDSDAVPPSSSSLSVDTSPNTSYTLLTTMKSNESKTDVNDEQVPESNVDVDVVRKVTSQSSISSLLDDVKQTRFEVTSVDALSLEGESGEKREHANSEFEIMSVVTDLDSSRNPTSTDGSLRVTSKIESGSEEDATSLSEASRVDAMTTTVKENTIPETQTTDSVGNGESIQPIPSRFKRVNIYVRDRWTVRDMAPPEEKDPQNPQNGSTNSFFSPPVSRKDFSSDTTMYSGSVSELGALSSGSGMLTDVSSEKDGAGSVIDRSSTAAESTLSRKSSLSSIIPDENFDTESVASASGSTAGRDRDTPEIAHGLQQQGHTPQLSVLTHLLPVSMPSTSVSSSGGPVSTTLVREESTAMAHGPTCSCESCSGSREREAVAVKPVQERDAVAVKPVQESQLLKGPDSVKNAMSHLQIELEQLLKTNVFVDKQNIGLLEENKQLQDRNQKLKEDNEKLKSDLEMLRKDMGVGGSQKLREENQKLKNELDKHRKALAIFVDDSNSNLSVNTSPPEDTS